MNRLILLIILLIPALAQGANPNVENAVVASFVDYRNNVHNPRWEYGSILVYKNGTYYHKKLLTDKSVHSVNLHVRDNLNSDEQLMALYHVHPCNKNYWSNDFSIPDVSLSLYWGVPAFILDGCTGNVHEYDDGIEGQNVTHPIPGRVVGNIGK